MTDPYIDDCVKKTNRTGGSQSFLTRETHRHLSGLFLIPYISLSGDGRRVNINSCCATMNVHPSWHSTLIYQTLVSWFTSTKCLLSIYIGLYLSYICYCVQPRFTWQFLKVWAIFFSHACLLMKVVFQDKISLPYYSLSWCWSICMLINLWCLFIQLAKGAICRLFGLTYSIVYMFCPLFCFIIEANTFTIYLYWYQYN